MSNDSKKPVAKDYLLKPGYIYLPDKPTVISTVLGSSVSVSIYDKALKKGGMNHFLFPLVGNQEKSTACYGNVAVNTLVRMMIETGSVVKDLEAQVFGGAFNKKWSQKDIGRENYITARKILAKKRIRVVSEDIGGELGRKIVFNTSNYEIVILKVERLRESDWYPYKSDR